MPGIAFGLIVVLLFFATAIKILREWERGVILRLGTFHAVRGPGITFVIPLLERMYRINTRVVTIDVPPQDVITKDNVTLHVNAVVFFRVLNPKEAVVNVEDFSAATSQKAQTVLRNVLGQSELDDLLAARDEIHLKLQAMLDAETDQWGMKVDAVEIKHVDLPQTMQRAMAGQAEAERARRAKIIAAEGELQAAPRLAEAAEIMRQHPISMQLRFLQTLVGVATENNATLVVPLPIDLITPLINLIERRHPPHSVSTASETVSPIRAGESGTPPPAAP